MPRDAQPRPVPAQGSDREGGTLRTCLLKTGTCVGSSLKSQPQDFVYQIKNNFWNRFQAKYLLSDRTTRWQDCKIKGFLKLPITHSGRAASRTPCWPMAIWEDLGCIYHVPTWVCKIKYFNFSPSLFICVVNSQMQHKIFSPWKRKLWPLAALLWRTWFSHCFYPAPSFPDNQFNLFKRA